MNTTPKAKKGLTAEQFLALRIALLDADWVAYTHLGAKHAVTKALEAMIKQVYDYMELGPDLVSEHGHIRPADGITPPVVQDSTTI